MWPTSRASRRGLIEFAIGAVALPVGIFTLEHAGQRYLETAWSGPRLLAGAALLVVAGVAVFGIARRREYPWLLALVAVAMPLFDPTQAPYDGGFRIVVAVRDLVLIGAAVLFVSHALRRSDELERRIHGEAVVWSYTAAVVVLLVHAMAADVLPPLRATWVASGLLAGWVVAWGVASRRYQP